MARTTASATAAFAIVVRASCRGGTNRLAVYELRPLFMRLALQLDARVREPVLSRWPAQFLQYGEQLRYAFPLWIRPFDGAWRRRWFG